MQGHWILGDGDLCKILYRLNGGDCVNPPGFVSPAADPAPWYQPTLGESTSFLGMFMLGIQGYDSTIQRTVTPRVQGLGGGTFMQQSRQPRTWKFRAALVSADAAGADYGLRWLTNLLSTTPCGPCDVCDLTIRMFCPPDDCSDDDAGVRTSYDVALVDGPHEVEQFAPRPGSLADTLAGCRDLVVVEWTMAAGNPFLYHAAEPCLAAVTVGGFPACNDFCDFFFGPPGTPHCCTVTPPPIGVIAPIYTFESVSGMNGLLLGAYETCPVGSDEGDPVYELALSGLPANATVEVNCATRTITVSAINGVFDGQSLIDLSDGRALQWPQAADCDLVTCFCARTAHPCSQGGDTTVAISTQLREG